MDCLSDDYSIDRRLCRLRVIFLRAGKLCGRLRRRLCCSLCCGQCCRKHGAIAVSRAIMVATSAIIMMLCFMAPI